MADLGVGPFVVHGRQRGQDLVIALTTSGSPHLLVIEPSGRLALLTEEEAGRPGRGEAPAPTPQQLQVLEDLSAQVTEVLSRGLLFGLGRVQICRRDSLTTRRPAV